MTPQPTPYDITQLPTFPAIPSVVWWIVLALLVIVTIAVVSAKRFESGKSAPAPSLDLQMRLFHEQLRARLAGGELQPQAALDQLASALRSLARVHLGPEVASATVAELQQRGFPRALAELLHRIETARFSRNLPTREEILDLSAKIQTMLASGATTQPRGL